MSRLYLIQNGYVGNSMLFWRLEGKGYTTEIEQAHRFTLKEAKKIRQACRYSHNFVIWPLSYLMSVRSYHVDVQNSNYSNVVS